MKVKSSHFFITAMLLGCLISCGRVDKILVKKEGKWNVTSWYEKVAVGGITTSENTVSDYGVAEFNDDGTGTLTHGSTATSFTWVWDKDKDQVTVNYADPILTTIPIVYDVTESKAKSQDWTGTGAVTTLGITTSYTRTMKMVRAD